MKQFTRYFSLVIAFTMAFSFANAQNTITKAQALGLKSNTVNVSAEKSTMSTRAVLLEEGFDADFPPTGWTVETFNATNNWVQDNPADNNFDEIDPASLFSALVGYIAEDQNEWVISPVIDAAGDSPLRVEWYAGVSGPWLNPGATLILNISTDGGTTWMPLWDAIDVIDPAADWAWNFVSTDLSAYADTPFQLGWQYVGNDGDLCAFDGVSVKTGYNYVYETGFEEWTAGEYLVDNAESGFWTTWSDAPATAEDAFVSDEQSVSPSNSVEMEGTSDLVLKMGDKTSGVYQFNVKYWIDTDFGGYINLQHFEAPGIEWAVEVYFGATTGDNNGFMYAGSADSIYFTHPHAQWMQLEFMIDLDNDWAEFYLDDVMLAEWQFSLQAQGEVGTPQLGGSNIYSGAMGTEVPHFYFDDIEFIVVQEGTTPPIMDVDDAPVAATVETGDIFETVFELGNAGFDDLLYNVTVTYPLGNKAMDQEPAGANAPKNINAVHTATTSLVSPNNEISERDITLNYDGDPASAIGSASDFEYRVSARFPADMLVPYIGTTLDKVDVFIQDQANEYKIQIYDMGNIHTPGPGELLHEQTFTDNGPESWVTVELDTPIFIEGGDIWVGYWLSATGGLFVPGTDGGPAHPDGDWFSTGPGWSHLSNNPDLDYNWNIRANLTGSPITKWLSTDASSGTLVADEYIDVTATLDATQVESDVYTGKIVIRSNDVVNDEATKTIVMNVVVGIGENGKEERIVVYPNPASNYLHIGSNGEITNVRLINTIGQIVSDHNVGLSDFTLSTENLPKGVYFVNIKTENGTTTQKVIIE